MSSTGKKVSWLVAAAVIALAETAGAEIVTSPTEFTGAETLIDFESIASGGSVSTQFPGLTFALVSGHLPNVLVDTTPRMFPPAGTKGLGNAPAAAPIPRPNLLISFGSLVNRVGFEIRSNSGDDLFLSFKRIGAGGVIGTDFFNTDTSFKYFGVESPIPFDQIEIDVTNNVNGFFRLDNLRYEFDPTITGPDSCALPAIYDNGVGFASSPIAGFFSSSFRGEATMAQYAVAEDVVMPPRGDSSPWSVKGVRWAGGFFSSVGGFRLLPTVGIPMDFVVLFYADAGGEPTGSPLDCLPGTAVAARLVRATGGPGHPVFSARAAQYEAVFESPVLLDPGTRYWISILASDASLDDSPGLLGTGWAWLGREGTGNAVQGWTGAGEFWIHQGRQQIFGLLGPSPCDDPSVPTVTITSHAELEAVNTPLPTIVATVVSAFETTVESDPPGILASLPPGGGTVSGSVPLPEEGLGSITLRVTDSFGKKGGTSVTLIRDTIPPVIDWVSPPDGTIVGDPHFFVTWETSDATDFHFELVGFGGLDLPGCDQLWSLYAEFVEGEIPEGPNTISVVATDAAGNATALSRVIVLDTTVPLVTIDAPLPGSCFGPGEETAAVVATVDDHSATTVSSSPSGVAGSLPPGGGVVAGSVLLVEGSNTITVTAEDGFGRLGSTLVSVILDTTAPAVSITAPADGAFVRGEVEFLADATDPGVGCGLSSVEFRVDGGLVAASAVPPFSALLDTTALPDGAHVVEARAVDGVGNASTHAIVVRVDNTPPAVTILSPGAGSYAHGTIAFAAEASDDGAGLSSIRMESGGVPPTGDASLVYALPLSSDTREATEDTTRWPDGPLTLSATAVDAAGNLATAEVIVTVDNTAPGEIVVRPCDGDRVRGTIDITAESADADLASLEIIVDGVSLGVSATSPFGIRYDTTDRLDGALVIEVRARDFADNLSATTVTVTIDNVSVNVTPSTLKLSSRGAAVVAHLRGASVPLLVPASAHALELRVPGGNPVPAIVSEMDDDEHGHGCRVRHSRNLRVRFDRGAVAASIQAGVSAGLIDPDRPLVVTITAESGQHVIGTDRIRIEPERGRRGGDRD